MYNFSLSRYMLRASSCRLAIIFTIVSGLCVSPNPADAGTWTQLTNAYPTGQSGLMLLLTDGSVMVQGCDGPGGQSAFWAKLTPDASGSYINGTWTRLASMGVDRAYFASAVLPNGKVIVLGCEITSSSTGYNTVEIYDPTLDTWTTIPYPELNISSGTCALLPSGKLLCGSATTSNTYYFDPSNNQFTKTGSKLRNDDNEEETWSLLPNGNVLTYESVNSPQVPPGLAQYFNPSTGVWADTGSVPVSLGNTNGGIGLGPVTMLPTGKLIYIGDTNSGIYNPSTNTWAAGPIMPVGVTHIAQDRIGAPGTMLPDGQFMFVCATPIGMMNYDYRTNAITDITSTLPPRLLSLMQSVGGTPYRRMVLLPNGHMLFNLGIGIIWDYAPSVAPQAAWKPTVSKIVKATGSTYTLTGTQLTGLWQGPTCDDGAMATNYPIVRLTDSTGKVSFARTTNWTPGVATGTTSATVDFTLPTGFVNGSYQLAVVANGIASANFPVTLPIPPTYNYVTSTYNSQTKTLTLAGDATANSIAITLRGNVLAVEAAGSTRIGTLASNVQQVSYTISGDVIIVGNFNQSSTPASSDTVTLVSVKSSSTTMTFGSGSDSVNLTYCTIGTLNLDGGTNPSQSPDTVTYVATTIATKHVTNVP